MQLNVGTQNWLKPAATCLVAGAAGWLFSLTGLPLGWLMGSMLAVAVASLFKLPAEQPKTLMPFVRASVGTMLGASVTAGLLLSFPQWWTSLVFLLIALLLSGSINFWLLSRILRFEKPTAVLCAMPGGITEMILLSEQAGADQARVAIVHALRIALSILILPLLITWFMHVDVQRSGTGATSSLSMIDTFWFALCIAAGVAADRWTRIPARIIVVPLILSAALHISGITHFVVPEWVTNIVQVFIGINVGGRFLGISARQLSHVVGAAFLVIAVQIAIAFSAAVLVARNSDLDPLALMLAYAPGGLAEMSLIAIAMGREVAFVGLHHLFRVLVSLALGPLLLSRLRKRNDPDR
ncbi:AbrB family transcriptional regulator [uncultured Roseibium sp.]|uniref:AbrB family transcriptional regulator n=1 Tax=uncultured Roseibium sp. TaxID=1936171 RepID=UPI00260E89EC|nr:AbrB family transcriptional regulator [uncultured Roseibium sp.]